MSFRKPTRDTGVRALCSQLGYSEIRDKESPRHFTRLATPVRQFRRIINTSDVHRCAVEFCERDEKEKHFFTNSEEARTHGWPILPNDKDKIIEKISRLICIQESISQETERANRNRNILSSFINNKSLGEADLEETRREDNIEEHTQSKTNEHLAWAYPEWQELKYEYDSCDIKENASSGHPRMGWLFQADKTAHWPDEPRSYVWRYMHQQNFYTLTPEFDETYDLVHEFIRHYKIICKRGQFPEIFDKFKHFVTFWTRTWLDYGMLQTNGDFVILRTNDFDIRLKLRQTNWPARKEILRSSRERTDGPACRPASNKRQRRLTGSPHRGSSAEESIVVDGANVGDPSKFMTSINISEHGDIRANHNKRRTLAVNGAIRRATNEVTCRPENDWRDSFINHVEELSPIPQSLPSESYSLSSISNSDTPETTAHNINQSAYSDHRIKSHTAQEQPKIKLFLQKADGEIDFQNPLPSIKFKDAGISEFFAMFSERSGLDASSLQSLTFEVVFAHNLPLKVNRGDDERKWVNLKRKISRLFKDAITDGWQENEFEIWVVEDNELAGL